MPSLTIIAKVQARPGHAETLLAAQQQLVVETLQEKGCLKYELHRSNEREGLVIFVESWETHADWQAHMTGEAMQRFQRSAGELIADAVIDQLTPV
ncbi:putative quinol monooxygenase [Lacibacterium aquatile]|uniref:Quinol monooxygenase n=1 Tax=Lacibacterium aquatile TaxID=1168082 RepID=A0ABW5DQG3_9PROT